MTRLLAKRGGPKGLKRGPLHGIKVVELGNAIAGPLCGALLGDMGADVVKVERPGRGDDSRRWGELVAGESPYFVQYNRSKRSICLNLQKKAGVDALKRLIRESDVLIENFRPGTMSRLGLSYDSVRKLNKHVIYCSVSGFGQTGPYANTGGYDAIVQGFSGIMAVTGEKEGPPLRVGVPITDILAALYAALAVSLALFHRKSSGEGQHIDVSLFESGVSAVAQWILINELTGKAVPRFGNRYPLLAPYELFETKDKPIIVAVGNDDLWSSLCKLIQRPELIKDPRFRTNTERIKPENRDVLSSLLGKEFHKKALAEWLRLLKEAGIPAGPINRIEDLANDEQLKSRHLLVQVRHKSLGKIKVVSGLPKLSLTPATMRRAPPTLGQHTDEVLYGLGYSKKEISHLRASGIL